MADTDQAARAQEALKADQARQENAKKKLADEKAAREQRMAETPDAGKPTPTQEENDLAAMGVHIPEHEPDGSPEQSTDPTLDPLTKRTKQAEAKKPGATYQTRAATPQS